MQIVKDSLSKRLMMELKHIKLDPTPHYALHFHFNRLTDEFRSDFHTKIALNILNDLFRGEAGYTYPFPNCDIILIYNGRQRELLERAVYQLRYLFMDDPLATSKKGRENPDFCDVYDLKSNLEGFREMCETLLNPEDIPQEAQEASGREFSPNGLVKFMSQLEMVDIAPAIRQQPICAIQPQKQAQPFFNEVYVMMQHLTKLLEMNVNIQSHAGLFDYITEALDRHMMTLIAETPEAFFRPAVSLNLHISSINSDRFEAFCEALRMQIKPSLVAEVHVADVFQNMDAFYRAAERLKKQKFRLCLDGLTNDSFIQLDREALGFDLAKLRWNADMAADLGDEKNTALKEAVKRCGNNRMILCRAESKEAIAYGHALGITLFQGRIVDKMLNPDATIVN